MMDPTFSPEAQGMDAVVKYLKTRVASPTQDSIPEAAAYALRTHQLLLGVVKKDTAKARIIPTEDEMHLMASQNLLGVLIGAEEDLLYHLKNDKAFFAANPDLVLNHQRIKTALNQLADPEQPVDAKAEALLAALPGEIMNSRYQRNSGQGIA